MKKVLVVLIFASVFSLPLKAAEGKTLFHVVAFKFKDGTTPEQIKKIQDAFRALKGKIPQVVSYVGAENSGKAERAKGFGHLAIVTFKTQADLDTYAAHPAHLEFKKMLEDVMADAFVYDFWDTEEPAK